MIKYAIQEILDMKQRSMCFDYTEFIIIFSYYLNILSVLPDAS